MALNLDSARKKAHVYNADKESALKKRALRKKFMETIAAIIASNRQDIEEILTGIGYTDISLTKLNKLQLNEYPEYLAISFALYKNTKHCFINLRCDDGEDHVVISNIGYRIEKKNIPVPESDDAVIPSAEKTVETMVNYIVDIFEDINSVNMKL